jgi:hypothetical protein
MQEDTSLLPALPSYSVDFLFPLTNRHAKKALTADPQAHSLVSAGHGTTTAALARTAQRRAANPKSDRFQRTKCDVVRNERQQQRCAPFERHALGAVH